MSQHADRRESQLVRAAVERHELKPDAIAAATDRHVSHIRRMLAGGFAVSADVARYVLRETGDADLRDWMLGAEVDPERLLAERCDAATREVATVIHALKRGAPAAMVRERVASAISSLSSLAPPTAAGGPISSRPAAGGPRRGVDLVA